MNTEKSFPEFNREKLMPYGVTQEGAPVAIADVNYDGNDDLFFGGTKGYTSVLYLSSNDNSYLKISDALKMTKDLKTQTQFLLMLIETATWIYLLFLRVNIMINQSIIKIGTLTMVMEISL